MLNSPEEIARAAGLEGRDAWGCGSTGYVNWSSGWADAEGAMRWLREKVEELKRVKFVVSSVKKLLIDHTTNTVSGVRLNDNSTLTADLTILAAGAWTASLIDLRGICKATGQVLCYLPITDAEQARLGSSPTILNLSTGLFMIPPSNNLLKVARHGHGYTNPTTTPHPESHFPTKSSGVRPITHSRIASPITGRNLNPCPLPPVATNKPLYLGW